jgi:hypothetical protein
MDGWATKQKHVYTEEGKVSHFGPNINCVLGMVMKYVGMLIVNFSRITKTY